MGEHRVKLSILAVWLISSWSIAIASEVRASSDVSIDAQSGVLRQPRITNGEAVWEGQYPFLTAVMTGRYATVNIDGITLDAFYFGAGLQSDFSGELVDCGLALAACAGVVNKVCAIAFDFPQPNSETLSPGQQLLKCQAGGGIAAVFRPNSQGYTDRLEFSDVEARIPAIYVADSRSYQVIVEALSTQQLQITVTHRIPEWVVCGGTYLGGSWVITAAHCVFENSLHGSRQLQPQELLVNVGAHDLGTDKQYTQQVMEIIVDRYLENGSWGEHDYALLRIDSEPLRGHPVELISRSELDRLADLSAPALVMGWGSTVVREPLTVTGNAIRPSRIPLVAELRLHTVSSCHVWWQDFLINNGIDGSGLQIRDIHICASDLMAQRDTCQGDSGGPLVVNTGDTLQLAGITNFGLGCGSKDSVPGVYASAPAFSEWVFEKTGLFETGRERYASDEVQENVTSPAPIKNRSASLSGAGSIGGLTLWLLALLIVVAQLRVRLAGSLLLYVEVLILKYKKGQKLRHLIRRVAM